jgi:hypothetical protein
MVKVTVIKQVIPENKFEERINDWLTQHPKAKIQSTAGVNAQLVIFYEE